MNQLKDANKTEPEKTNVKQWSTDTAGASEKDLPSWMTEETWNAYLEIERY